MKYLLTAVILLLFDVLGFLSGVKSFVINYVSPVQLGLSTSAQSINSSLSFYKSIQNLRDENINLLEKVLTLESELLTLKSSQEENKILRDQLAVANQNTFDKKFVIASVLGNPDDLSGTSVYLDKGLIHGIKSGNNVIVANNLIGIVRKVTENKSLVELIYSPGISISAYDIDSPDKTQGIITGKHGSSIVLQKILQSEQVKIGDYVITSGKDGVFFPNIIIGKITNIEQDTSLPLKEAEVLPLVNIFKVEKVFVLVD